MPRGPCTFKQRDVMRALRATRAAGVDVQRIEIEKDGKIIIVPGKEQHALLQTSELDQWMVKHRAD